MPKSSGQKRKLLCIRDILLTYTDEAHPITVAGIIEKLEAYGIAAERKSIYDDLETLRSTGLDIISVKGKTVGYYIGSRKFELAELKLLVDSVQSSKFITQKKTLELIKKLESLCSVHEAKQLSRQIYVSGRIKSMNESIYYNVDKIHSAISANRAIHFRYFNYAVTKERVFRKNGALYCISPFALTWDDENYYMIGFDDEAQLLKHFRVDKMTDITLADMPRTGREQFDQIDMAVYAKKTFSMFSGNDQIVTIEFENHLAGVVIDRFGKDVSMTPSDNTHFIVHTNVSVSPQFFAWLFGLEGGAKLLAPERALAQMREHIRIFYENHQS